MTHRNYDDASQKVEIVCDQHNHLIITERRKKGSLKDLKETSTAEIIEESILENDNLSFDQIIS